MCGVGAVFRYKAISQEEMSPPFIESVLATLRARGPDGEAYHLEGNTVLFHTLLKVMDLGDLCKQPMLSPDGSAGLVFNGEIYNYLELRLELEKRYGLQFVSHSDTEVLLNGLIHEGEKFIEKLNGDFAFIFLNYKKQQALVARDRFGIKPLYYAKNEMGIFFASRMETLFKMGVSRKIARENLHDYLRFRYSRSAETPFASVQRFSPATFWQIDLSNLSIDEKKYWQVSQSPKQIMQIDELKTLMKSSVDLRLRGMAPASIFLSGGIDSSYLATMLPEGTQALYYQVPNSPDEIFAQSFAQEHRLRFDVIPHCRIGEEAIKQVLSKIEEPIADSILLANSQLFKAAANFSKVALSGEGADEIFGGYAHQQLILLWQQVFPLEFLKAGAKSLPLRQVLRWLGALNPYPVPIDDDLVARFERSLHLKGSPELYDNFTSVFTNEELGNLGFSVGNKIKPSATYEKFESLYLEFRDRDLQHWLSNYGLLRQDKLSMSEGLEVRSPYLDHRLVEGVNSVYFNCPFWRLRQKALLKRMSKGDLSTQFYRRRKHPFFIPNNSAEIENLRRLAESVLDKKRILATGLFNPDAIQQIVNSKNKNFMWFKKTLSLLVVQIWVETMS